jgi:hypothetical protein
MATTRKKTVRNTRKSKPAGGITQAKAKVKRVAREAREMIGVAAHDAKLAFGRAGRKLTGAAHTLEAKVEEAKGPAKRAARRIEGKVAAAWESAGESISVAKRKAKSGLVAAKKAIVEATGKKKPAARKPAAKKPAAKKAVARRK